MKSNVMELSAYVDALIPIICLSTSDMQQADDLIREIRMNQDIQVFHNGLGVIDFSTKSLLASTDIISFLNAVKDDGYDSPQILVLNDVQDELKNPEVIALLKYISYRNMNIEGYQATVFIVAKTVQIPSNLDDYVMVYDVPLPSADDINRIVENFGKEIPVSPDNGILSSLANSFKGMSCYQIKQLLNLSFQNGGILEQEDISFILHQKKQLIKKTGLLELMPLKETIRDIGGLDCLKEWLERKSVIFNDLDNAVKFGVDVPKGIMIAGMPGCGKSLTAKATATLFGVPLVRLDIGRLMGKYVGESEENMRQALKLAEAISPCVLWIDELEKAFAGLNSSNGGEVTIRLFGQFLTWMQENEHAVFIVATANDISNLPPEFMRKGRFDELFFVDLPNEQERRQIFYIQLKKRKRWHKKLDVQKLAAETKGYNGADIEAIVKEAIENCFLDEGKALTTEDLIEAKMGIESINQIMGTRLGVIRKKIEAMHLKAASGERKKERPARLKTKQNLQESIHQMDMKILFQ